MQEYDWQREDGVKPGAVLRDLFRWVDPQDGEIIVDIGCGNGRFMEKLGAVNPNAVLIGTELEAVGAALAKRRTRRETIICDAMNLPLRDGAIDKVLMYHVIEHLQDAKVGVRELERVLRRGGLVIAGYPNASALVYRLGLAKHPKTHIQRLNYDFGFEPLLVLRRKAYQPVKVLNDWIPELMQLYRLRFFAGLFYNVLVLARKDSASGEVGSRLGGSVVDKFAG